MKRVLILLTLAFTLTFSGFAQGLPVDLNDLENQLKTLSSDLSKPVASAATLGLTWSDANIGGFPHFGIGIFTGASMLPIDGFSDLLEFVDPNATLPDAVKNIPLGLPLPAAGIDARIGGFILPFDIGVKFAMFNLPIDKVTIDYSLIGADVRYALLKENLVLPGISIGVGYSRFTSSINIAGILDDDYKLYDASTTLNDNGIPDLILKNPDLDFGWTSDVIEAKAQISKSLIFITPYVGANLSYGITEIGGGLKTAVVDQNGDPLDQEAIDAALEEGGLSGVKPDGFTVMNSVTGMGLKVHGGLSFNLFLAKIDINASYDVMALTVGAQVGFRIQL